MCVRVREHARWKCKLAIVRSLARKMGSIASKAPRSVASGRKRTSILLCTLSKVPSAASRIGSS
eukprot:6174085-Alexandrium_andersonii.AAC.1